jgi:PleD family two-component response regulator
LGARSGAREFQSELTKANAEIPIIFITGHGDIPMTVRAMKAGAVEFLTKPFRDQDLLDAIQVALERARVKGEKDRAVSDLKRTFFDFDTARTGGHGLGNRRFIEQAGRRRDRSDRNHRESAPRQCHAENGCEIFCRFGENG